MTAWAWCRPDLNPFPTTGCLEMANELGDYEPASFDFRFDLAVDANRSGILVGPNGCQCSGELRFDRSELDTLALQWASEENLPWPDRIALLVKLNKLPWADDDITFHWGHWEEIEKPGINGFCDPSSNSDTKDAPS